MPSKPVWGRELPGGFDSRPPPRGGIGEMLWSSRGFASSPRSHYVHPRFVQTTTAWLVRYDIDPQAHRRQPPQALSPDPRGQLRCLTDAPILRRGHSDCRTFVTARTSGSPVRARTSPVPTHLGSSRCPDQRRLGFLLCSLRLRVEISGRDEGVGRAPHLPFTHEVSGRSIDRFPRRRRRVPQTQSGRDLSPIPSIGSGAMPEPSARITTSPGAENTMRLPSGDHAGVYARS